MEEVVEKENIETTENKLEAVKNLLHAKKKILIPAVAVLAIILLILITGLVVSSKKPKENVITPTSAPQTASIKFLAKQAELDAPSTETTTDIIVESLGRSASGVTVNLEFDPDVIELKSFSLNNSDTSFLGPQGKLIEFLRVKPGLGRITVDLTSNIAERKGKGSIGAVTFKIKNMPAQKTYEVSFGTGTEIISRTPGSKTLLTTTPLYIELKNAANTTTQSQAERNRQQIELLKK